MDQSKKVKGDIQIASAKSREPLFNEQEKRLREEIERRHGKAIEELHEERQKRYRDAVELREPDRVPVTLSTGVFAARHAGLTASAIYYDHAARRFNEAQVINIIKLTSNKHQPHPVFWS